MADKAGLYGGTGTAFPSEVDGGKKLYWEINPYLNGHERIDCS